MYADELAKPFSSVIWPVDFWRAISPEQVDIARKFTKAIENVLGAQCNEISFEEIWSKSPPAEAGRLTLPEYINPVSLVSVEHFAHILID